MACGCSKTAEQKKAAKLEQQLRRKAAREARLAKTTAAKK